MASSSKDSSSHERRSSSHSASQQKLPWNPVLKTDRPKYGYAAREPPAPKKESPRAPEKRPAVPRFRHPPPAPRSEEEFERRPAVPRFRHPPERETKEDHPLIRGLERRKHAGAVAVPGLESLESAAQGGQENRSELRPVKCRYCAQLLVVATQQQHERTCFERMLTDFLPGDEELPSARSQRPVRRSRSNSADRVVAAVPGGAEPSWAPSEQLRSRAQRHQQQVHAATKEAMVAEEDEDNGIMLTVDALEVDFKSFAKELSSLALPSAALALMGQLQGSPQQTALDQLIDLQRRHSVLGSILRLAEEHRTSKAPPFGPHPLAPHTPTGWPPPPVQSLSSSAETPRKSRVTSTLPPLDLELPPSRQLSRSSSRSDASLRSASVASLSDRFPGRPQGGRQRSGSVKSARSAVGSGRASRASRASCGRVSRAASEVTLRASPGPAAVGFREMSVEEMKAEIEAERQQYIAERLSAAAR